MFPVHPRMWAVKVVINATVEGVCEVLRRRQDGAKPLP